MTTTTIRADYRLVTGPNGTVSVQCISEPNWFYSLGRLETDRARQGPLERRPQGNLWIGATTMTTVILNRADLDEFCAQWPCHGIPATLASITFEYAENGDLVDIIAKSRNGRVVDSADFDGPALAALSEDAQMLAATREPITPVIFRRMNKGHGGEVLAVFPTDAASMNAHECGCYAHVGQHSACDPWHIMRNSKPAKPTEYADLKAELEGAPYGYRFEIYTRLQSRWLEDRARALREQGGARIPKCGCDEREEIINRHSRAEACD